MVCWGGGPFVKPQLGFGGYNLLSMLHTGVFPSKSMVAALRLMSWDEEKSVIQLFSFFFFFLLALVEGLPGKFLQTMHGVNGMASFLLQYNTFTYLPPYFSSHTATSLLSTIVPLELSPIIC